MPGQVIQAFLVGGGQRETLCDISGIDTRTPKPSEGRVVALDPMRIGLVGHGGRALSGALLAKMEGAFGADFSAVRVYVGPQASRIGALAFTTGNDIYFALGQYQPDTVRGQRLIGHELAHVVQQRQGRVQVPGSGLAIVQDRGLEAEADRLGMHAAMYRPVQPKMARHAAMHRGVLQRRAGIPTTATAMGSGRTRIAAGNRGSLVAQAGKGGAVLVTDLEVGRAHREQGIGRDLLASAAQAGLRSGKSSVSLSAQDNGSGRLTRWYLDMGFRQIGVNDRGHPELVAPIGRLIGMAAQPEMVAGARAGSGVRTPRLGQW